MNNKAQVIANHPLPSDPGVQMRYAPDAMPTTFVNQFAVGFTPAEVYITFGEAPFSGPEANQSLAKVRVAMSHANLLNLVFQLSVTTRTLQELYGGPIPTFAPRSPEEMQEILKRIMTEAQQQAQQIQPQPEGLG